MSEESPQSAGSEDAGTDRSALPAEAMVEDVRGEVEPSRRTVLRRGAKVLVYTAPLVQMFRPSQALAASGVSPGS